jgi:16S rRNA (uracil1498-N3)-methyltransferase
MNSRRRPEWGIIFMKRFILPSAPDKAGIVRLSGDDYHYLVRVRRFIVGTEFSALLPDGEAIRARVRSVSAERGAGVLEVECLAERCQTPLAEGCQTLLAGGCQTPSAEGYQTPPTKKCLTPSPPIVLFQAIPKGAKMDLIVRQATEGGVSEILPFVSAYSVPKIADKRSEDSAVSDKTARWRRIVREARQQSGSETATVVHEPFSVDELLRYWEGIKNQYSSVNAAAVGIFLHPPALLPAVTRLPLVRANSFHASLDEPPGCVALAVGPEGGFSPEEAACFISADFKPLDLGNTILRTETAAVYAVAAVRIILLERASWILKSLPR